MSIPINIPATALGPKINPISNGVPITSNPGLTISLKDALVEIYMHAL